MADDRLDTRNMDEDDPDVIKLFEEITQYAGESPEDGIQLIREDTWIDYCKECADEFGYMSMEILVDKHNPYGSTKTVTVSDQWPFKHIDWEAAADEWKEDYTEVEYDGATYYYR